MNAKNNTNDTAKDITKHNTDDITIQDVYKSLKKMSNNIHIFDPNSNILEFSFNATFTNFSSYNMTTVHSDIISQYSVNLYETQYISLFDKKSNFEGLENTTTDVDMICFKFSNIHIENNSVIFTWATDTSTEVEYESLKLYAILLFNTESVYKIIGDYIDKSK